MHRLSQNLTTPILMLFAGVSANSVTASELVSRANDGSLANSFSQEASISEDGRFVAFQSTASNLAPGDVPPTRPFGSTEADIFVFDTRNETIELISAGLDGFPANSSRDPEISGDGRYVAFVSNATNLVPNDLNDASDIFFYDRETDSLQRVNEGPGGEDADGLSDGIAISFDGSLVAFESTAPNLVSGDTNGLRDIFVWSRQTDTIERVSIAPGGVEADGISDQPAFSRDARFLAFESNATNFVAADTNGRRDIFLADLAGDTIERVNVLNDGTETDANSEHPAVSADGRFVAFESRASNLVPDVLNGSNSIYVKDRLTGEVSLISQSTSGVSADGFCEWPSISPNGRLVVFDCPATTLVDLDNGGSESVYLRDRATGVTSLVALGLGGVPADGRSFRPSIGVDAVAFASLGTNLVAGDDNDQEDIFVVRFGLFADGFE
ncbi:MAG: calcium-binding protein [Pseudomonadota bacterium]